MLERSLKKDGITSSTSKKLNMDILGEGVDTDPLSFSAKKTYSFIERSDAIMKNFLTIIGIILALPILLTLVVLVVISLVGGYILAIAYYLWWVLVPIILIIIGVIVLKHIL